MPSTKKKLAATSTSKQELNTLLLTLKRLSKTKGSVRDFNSKRNVRRVLGKFILNHCEPRAHVHLVKHYLAKGCSFTVCTSEDDYYRLRAGWESSEPDSDYSDSEDDGFEGEPLLKSTEYEMVLKEASCNGMAWAIIYDAKGDEIETCEFNLNCNPFKETVDGPDDWMDVYEAQPLDWYNLERDYQHLNWENYNNASEDEQWAAYGGEGGGPVCDSDSESASE